MTVNRLSVWPPWRGQADASHAELLRNYPLFYEHYDKWKRGAKIKKCTLCRMGRLCEICQLTKTWYAPNAIGGRKRVMGE